MKLSSLIKKKKTQTNVNIKIDEELYQKLKEVLKANKTSLHDFFVASVELYFKEQKQQKTK